MLKREMLLRISEVATEAASKYNADFDKLSKEVRDSDMKGRCKIYSYDDYVAEYPVLEADTGYGYERINECLNLNSCRYERKQHAEANRDADWLVDVISTGDMYGFADKIKELIHVDINDLDKLVMYELTDKFGEVCYICRDGMVDNEIFKNGWACDSSAGADVAEPVDEEVWELIENNIDKMDVFLVYEHINNKDNSLVDKVNVPGYVPAGCGTIYTYNPDRVEGFKCILSETIGKGVGIRAESEIAMKDKKKKLDGLGQEAKEAGTGKQGKHGVVN